MQDEQEGAKGDIFEIEICKKKVDDSGSKASRDLAGRELNAIVSISVLTCLGHRSFPCSGKSL